MITIAVTIEPHPEKLAMLQATQQRLKAIYKRHNTSVRVYRPLSGSVTGFLAVFDFETLQAMEIWSDAVDADSEHREAMTTFRDCVQSMHQTIYRTVDS